MSTTTVRTTWLTTGLCVLFLSGTITYGEDAPAEEKKPAAKSKLVVWHQSLAAGIEDARKRKVPILVKVGAEWCGWCHKLDAEMEQAEVQEELRKWVLVRLDADDDKDDVRKLSIGPIPALRILDTSGRPTRSHEGFLEAAEFIDWLNDRSAIAEETPSLEVLDGEFDPKTLPQVVQLLGHRDPSIREAATRRLAPRKNVAGSAVAEAFTRGTLAVRLATVDLLSTWKAPVDDLDPWRPETISAQRLNALEGWVDQLEAAETPAETPAEVPLTPHELEASRKEILRLPEVDGSEAEAIGARLAHHGAALLPIVKELRGLAETDLGRERFDWLRYRLVASDTLALRWPTGLTKLAATNPQARREAATELSTVITAGDERLLVELFENPDPIVREMALKALHEVGGTRAQEELTKLLADPEPNVRTAVLKEMAAHPSPKLVPVIADYVTREKDADLIVHAVRLLRAIKNAAAVECLLTLLPNPSWQVRAETVDAIGEIVADQARRQNTTGGVTEEIQADAYVAILDVLADQDGFVVSRAVNALMDSDLAIAAPKLAAVAETHVELGEAIAKSLVRGSKIRVKGIPIIQTWLTRKEAHLRAAAIPVLGRMIELDWEKELISALSDSSEKVRIAAAETVWSHCEAQRAMLKDNDESVAAVEVISPASTPLGALEWIISQFLPDDGFIVSPPDSKKRVGVDIDFDAAAPTPKVKKVRAGKSDAAEHPQEDWLEQFLAAKGPPTWGAMALKPLGIMLKSASSAEQLAAGTALVALGEDAVALSVLFKLAQQEQQLSVVSHSLRWLPWAKRAEFFGRLRPLATDPHQLAALCHELILLRDTRASTILWDVLTAENVDGELAESIYGSLGSNHRIATERYAYWGDQKPPTPVGVDLELWKKLGTSGTPWQQRIAWLFLLVVDEDACVEVAQAVLKNAELRSELRADAFRMILLCTPKSEAGQIAATEILDLKSPARRPALSFLIVGKSGIHAIADGALSIPSRGAEDLQPDKNPPKLPPELTAEHLRSFLMDSDEQIVAQSAYLLALLGHTDGLDRLIAYYRKIGEHPENDELQQDREQWERRVYEAIAASDDLKYLSLLEQIYERMARDRRHEVREFYWTIRTMHGAEILQFRKRIRAEIGMDNLR